MRNDNFTDKGFTDNPGNDDYFEEDSGSLWNKGKNGKYRSAAPKKNGIPVLTVVVGLGILAVLAVFVLLDFGQSDESSKVLLLESKLAQLEARLAALDHEPRDSELSQNNARELKKVQARFNRLETSLTSRLDHMSKDISRLEKRQKPAAASQKPAAASPAAVPGVKTHIVAKGETLYSISRQYGLTVDELLALNKLGKGSVIKVGQRLQVRK